MLELLGFRYRFEKYSRGAVVHVDGAAGVLTYGHDEPRVMGAPRLHLNASAFFDEGHYLTRRSLPQTPMAAGDTVCFFQSNGSRPPEPDIVASTFFLLTGYEEVVAAGEEDKRGRRLAAASSLVSAGLLRRPLVHEYAKVLESAIHRSMPALVAAAPDRSPLTLVITRDIDSLMKERQGMLSRVARRVVRSATSEMSIAAPGRRRNHHNNLDEICDWEDRRGIRSSMYFMSSHCVGDSNYSLSDPAVCSRMGSMQRNGWEIGFHPGCKTFVDGGAFRRQQHELAAAAGGDVRGGRQHGLRFRIPYTWRHWEDGGFLYDSSIGYAEHEGFRSGICVPYRPFDLLENRTMGLWELPLTVMDCTLDRYRGLEPEAAGRLLDELADIVSRSQGVFVLLWHNTYFGRSNAGSFHDVFAGFVNRTLSGGASVRRAIDVVSDWQTRSAGLQLV